MAITPSDFSKIWASNADTPEYTFSEADYLKGWDFVGNLPPTRAQWNAMQKSTDEKMKYVFDNFGAPLTASTVAEMTMRNRVYVYTGSETGYTAGHWYYWNGSAWVSGGIYNAVAFQTDPTLTITGAAADAEITGQCIRSIYDGKKRIIFTEFPGYIGDNGSILNPSSTSKEVYTNKIAVSEGDVFDLSLTYSTSHSMWLVVARYDDTNKFIGRNTLVSSVTQESYNGQWVVPANTGYVAFSYRTFDDATFVAKQSIFDSTLSVSGRYAESKIVGDKVTFLKDIDLKMLNRYGCFPNMVRGGLDNTTGELTTQTWAVSSPDWFSFDYPVELHVAEGYQFLVVTKNRETGAITYGSYSNHNSPGYVLLMDTYDVKIMITRNPITYSAADPDTFAKQVTFNLPSWYVEQVNKMNIEKLKNGNCLLDGLMVRGTYNPAYISYVYYRVVPRRILQFDRDITITANEGFRFAVQYFNEEGTRTADLGWKTFYTIPANQRFIVIIARTTENTSEIADILYFWNQLNVSTPLKELVEDGSASVNFLRDFFKCGGKPKLCSHAGYKVGSIENSIPAFEAAGENGYWCLESDVQQTSDGYFIMMHDTTVDRTTNGTGSIASMTLAQIMELHLKGFPDLKVPTLQEYLAICKRYNMVPQLEMKSTVSDYAGLIAEIKKAGMYWNTMLSGSEYSISNIRQITNDIPYIAIAQAGAYPSGYDGIINRVKAFKNVGIALEHTGTITETQVLTCHDADMPICVFTCDTEAKVQEMLELGADCVTTNIVLP